MQVFLFATFSSAGNFVLIIIFVCILSGKDWFSSCCFFFDWPINWIFCNIPYIISVFIIWNWFLLPVPVIFKVFYGVAIDWIVPNMLPWCIRMCYTLVFFSGQVKAFIGLGPVYTVTHLKGLVRLMVDALPEEEVCHIIGATLF